MADDSLPLPRRRLWVLHLHQWPQAWPCNLWHQSLQKDDASLSCKLRSGHMLGLGQRNEGRSDMSFPSASSEPGSSWPCLAFLFHQGRALERRRGGAEPQLTHTGYLCSCNHWGFASTGKTGLAWLRQSLTQVPSASLRTFNCRSSHLTSSRKFPSTTFLITVFAITFPHINA